MPPNFKQFKAARKYGYRSGLEVKISDYLKELKVDFGYECVKIEWEDLAYRTYTPDFVLPNGIIIETKGMFTAADRRKHLAIKRQHPNLDIRFVFENSRRKLRKGAKSTYGEWPITSSLANLTINLALSQNDFMSFDILDVICR